MCCASGGSDNYRTSIVYGQCSLHEAACTWLQAHCLSNTTFVVSVWSSNAKLGTVVLKEALHNFHCFYL